MPDWRRNLLILTGSMFFIMVGWTCFLPFIPHFIQDELGVTSLAAAEVWTGIVIALGPMTIALSSPFWGGVADRRGHKRIVVQSVIGLGVATALMSVSTNVWQLAAIRAFSGFFSGFLPAAIGFVGANFPQAVLGYALGIVQMGQMTGSILGPVAGGWIVHYFGYRGAFVAGSALCLITLPAILFGVKESSRRLAPSVRRFELRDAVTLARRERPFLAILLSLFTAQLALRGLEPRTPHKDFI
ncbi:MAG: MFS transporter [Clostridia bacterium]|nr:MFS transporter [Clostridia bacterium]